MKFNLCIVYIYLPMPTYFHWRQTVTNSSEMINKGLWARICFYFSSQQIQYDKIIYSQKYLFNQNTGNATPRLHLVLKLFQNNSLKRLQFYWEVESDIFFSQQKTTLSSSIESKTGIQLHIADPPLWDIFVQFNSCIMENQVRLLCDLSAIYTMRCQW